MSRRWTVPALALEGQPCVYLSDRAPWAGVWMPGARVWVLMDMVVDGRERTYVLGVGVDVSDALRAAADAYDQAAAEAVHVH